MTEHIKEKVADLCTVRSVSFTTQFLKRKVEWGTGTVNNAVEQCTENTFENEILISMKLLKLEENIFESDALMLSFQKEWADYIKKLERRIEKLKKNARECSHRALVQPIHTFEGHDRINQNKKETLMEDARRYRKWEEISGRNLRLAHMLDRLGKVVCVDAREYTFRSDKSSRYWVFLYQDAPVTYHGGELYKDFPEVLSEQEKMEVRQLLSITD